MELVQQHYFGHCKSSASSSKILKHYSYGIMKHHETSKQLSQANKYSMEAATIGDKVLKETQAIKEILCGMEKSLNNMNSIQKSVSNIDKNTKELLEYIKERDKKKWWGW
jgi:phosphoenolpyruvate carboxylase